MRTLSNAILNDCARIIDRHPDLSPDYKRRLLDGLDRADALLTEKQAAVAAEPVPAKAGKR
jgi:hypothetical protein